MKKKIGELTLNEIKQICEKNVDKGCLKCPLIKYPFCIEDEDYDLLNEEIEVEDDDKN